VLKFLFLLTIFLTHSVYASDEICSSVILHGDKIKLDETEKRLVCGDKEVLAYKNIPAYESSFVMTAFLQSRGYLSPKYSYVHDKLHVEVGHKSTVKKITVVSDNDIIRRLVKRELIRLYKRKTLTTSVLNSIEAEALSLLRQNGYPCSKIKAQVDISTENVVIDLGELYYFEFGEIKKEPIPGLRENALDRFYPFQSNDPFNEDLLKLTEKRITRSEVLQGTYFLETCAEDHKSFGLAQQFLVGPAKTIRFGAGASTEVGPMARIKWSNNRYKSMASLLSANLQASLRSQSLTLSADSFFWHNEPRRSLFSEAQIIRESQIDYEQLVYRFKPHMKWTRDSEGHFKSYTIGPSYEGGTFHSEEDANTKSFSSGIIEGSLLWMSHTYELFDVHPEDGDSFNLNFDFRHPAIGFSDPLLKLDSSIVKLERMGNWGRGAIIGGARLNAGTTWVTNTLSGNSLPPTVKFYGGGSDDIRGFQLRTLPHNGGLGALTKLTLKLEARRTYVYQENIEAFTFVDSGYFGQQSWGIDSTLYYSPGVGIRWLSPLGLVQTFIARALTANPNKDSGNLYYVGLGGTF
jgi:translocation and assembly module TamA